MTKQIRAKLQLAFRRKTPARFTRPFEPGTVNGYVQAIGPQWFLLALVSDQIRFDGFQCFRLRDIRNLQIPHPYAQFIEDTLKKRRILLPKMPRVNLATLDQLLQSANRAFPLVTIHREQVDPDACWIGRILNVDRKHVTLLEIDPGATWENSPVDYRLPEITRVDFGGDYEDALFLVGGDPVPEEGMRIK
jgi:hypothetical protein